MRLRHIPGAEKQIEESTFVIQEPEQKKGFCMILRSSGHRRATGMNFSAMTIRSTLKSAWVKVSLS